MSAARRHLGTWVLVAVAAALLVAVFATRGKVTTGEREARPNNLLAAWRENDVTRVEIEREGTRIVLERDAIDDAGDATWMIRAPIAEEADADGVQSLLDTLEFATFQRRIEPAEVNRAAFGLDAPRVQVLARMGAMTFRIVVGKPAPTPKGSAYAEVSGDGVPRTGVGIVSRDLVAELELTVDSFRDRDLVPYLSSALARIVLDGAGGRRPLRRLRHGLWRFDGIRADRRVQRDAFDALTVQLARTTADHFLPLAAAEQAQAGAELVDVELHPKDPKLPKLRLRLGGTCPKSADDTVAIRREPDPVAACVAKSVLPGLKTPAAELDDASLFSLRKDEVESLLVTEGDRRLDLARKESGFVMRAPQQVEVDGDAGNARIAAIVATRGKLIEAPDLAALGLVSPSLQVTLKSTGEDESRASDEAVSLSAPRPDGTRYALRQQDGAVFEIGRESSRPLGPDASLVRSRRILTFSQMEFREAEIVGGATPQKLTRAVSGAFSLEAPKDHRHDAGLAADLVEALGTLVAERWVADRDDGSFGLAQPALELRVAWDSGDAGRRSQTLRVGAPADGGSYASLAGDPGVFVVPKRVVTSLETWLLDRSVTLVSPDDHGSVRVESAGRSVELVKDGDHFVEKPGAGGVGPDRARRIAEALTLLRAEAATHLGAPAPAEGFARPILVIRAEPLPERKKEVGAALIRIGAGDSWRGVAVHHARRDGVDASYVVARSKVQQILDAL
jgi:hypothetical protein